MLFIFLSFTRVELEFISHLTGDPRPTEIAADNIPSCHISKASFFGFFRVHPLVITAPPQLFSIIYLL